jgi:hypothetical protein
VDQALRLRDICIENYSNFGSFSKSSYVYHNCTKLLSYISDVGGQVASFDGRKYMFEWEAMLAPFRGYLSNNTAQDDVYKALHVENSTRS